MKDYMCEICDEVLKNKPALQKHIKHRHNTSENVYYCDVCTKSCQNKNVLKNHLKSVHGGRHYNCNLVKNHFQKQDL